MKKIAGFLQLVWLTGRRLNHFMISNFDENRLKYCFFWFPVAMILIALSAVVAGLLHQAIGGMAAWALLGPLYIIFSLPWAGLFFVAFFLLVQAYFGFFARLGVPLFPKVEQFSAEFVGLFREGGKPRSEPKKKL